MKRKLQIAFVIIFLPLFFVFVYTVLLICATAPVSVLSIEKAGQFGDAFGVVTCLFSGLAFSGVLITLYLQREEMIHSAQEQAKNARLVALASLMPVYYELAAKKQMELDNVPLFDTGRVGEALKKEWADILKKRNAISIELERAAGLDLDAKK